MRHMKRLALRGAALAVAPLLLSTVVGHAEVDSPPLAIPGLHGNCAGAGGGTVRVLTSSGVLIVNSGYVWVDGLDCWV